ncbi:tetratricopeptide repeat protein [Akkermansiaceae bacterium]|nr:tetratricopeptide repeat protein [Akkermansiaceae bacterium]
MKTKFAHIPVAILLALPLSGAPAEEAAKLEARLKESAEASPPAAEMMLQLIDLYKEDGQVFGLIRTASKFSRAQTEHPRRAEVTLDLIKGYAAAARHEDVITTARQFLDIFPQNPLTDEVRDHIASAYERTGRVTQAAEQRGLAWQNGAPTEQGIAAIRLWVSTDKVDSYAKATELAALMADKIAVDGKLTGIGLRGIESALRAEKFAEGLKIANALARRNATMDAETDKRLAFLKGLCETRLGQHGNAVASFRKSLVPGNDERHRALIDAMVAAKNPPAEIEAEARRYADAFPQREDRYDPLARSAHAAAEGGNMGAALRIAEDVMKHDAISRDIARAYAGWCGDDNNRAAGGLAAAIEANKKGAPRLRAVLALDVYRDRMKDNAKAREAALRFLELSPAEDAWTEEIVKFLYDSSATSETFREDLKKVTESAGKFPHLAGFQDRVWNPAPADKERNREWQKAKRDYQSDAITRLWRATREDGGRSGQACKELLGKQWPAEIRRHLLSRLSYVYRHHLGGKSREVSAGHYETLCKEFPKDSDAAARWLEAASQSGKEQQLAAARHLLTLPPVGMHPDNWIRLCETKDEAITRKAAPWITQSAAASQSPLYHASRIGDLMAEIGMKTEAAAWWRSRMDLDPANRDAISCTLRLAGTMDAPQAADFLAKRLEAATENQGVYAAAIADLHFKAGDIASMAKVLSASRNAADQHPFLEWGMGEWPARGWLEAARNSKEMPEADKKRIYEIILDLRLGRISAEAGMMLIGDRKHDLARLLETQELILMCEPHHESWERLYPFAQAALAKEDPSLAAAILNGLINTIRSVGGDQMADARTLLRKAYGEMGGLSADIPADSPIAPLLQIVLHLRLGETELAEEAYFKNKALFDAHRTELPVELLLFGAGIHIAQGTPEDHERAEDILRGWMMKFGEAENVDIRDKARVQLLLARNYQRALQFDIARAEFTTVLNTYRDQPEAIEARFGIGETYMAQKVYDQASELFTELAESPVPAISIRANFLLGVLALRQEDSENARRIFLSVLENSPDADLANETLYNLAEVYGIEQRFLTQLETLRTVGRLGQDSKVWQTPGNALPIVVQDPDLGISRGDTRIPVVVRTEPGNDEERSFLTSGGAGKGIFLSEIPTVLGEAKPNDGVLQVTGADTITVDYPEDFKKEFQFGFPGNTRLRIASDGSLDIASTEIANDAKETITDDLKKEMDEEKEEKPRSAIRPSNQVKPGNLIFIQVKDGDRDVTTAPDEVGIRLTASGGDEVQVKISEESSHGGIFRGTVRTGELPAGAGASDSALDHSPLMAIDHDPNSSWRSEPDGAAPKLLTVDMKELRDVTTIVLTSPDADNEAPVRMAVRGSHDGRFWFRLADLPPPPPADKITFPEKGMFLRTYRLPANELRENYTWEQIADIAKKLEPTTKEEVASISWTAPEEDENAHFLIWSGPLVQERDGAMRFSVSGRTTALMLDGKLELPPGEDGRSVDLLVARGIHHITVFSIAEPKAKSAGAVRARENRNSSAVSLHPFAASDFDIAAFEGLTESGDATTNQINKEANTWTLDMPSRKLRHIEFSFLEYRGEAVAVSNVEISGGGARHIPPAQDVLQLADNDILELAPGDSVQVSYLDELTAGRHQPNRLLTRSLTATYYNGEIIPITYDFQRTGGGSVSGSRKELLRIDPGERIVAEITDFDLDTGLDRDTVEIEVQVNADASVKYLATETGSSTGVFLAEIDTAAEADGSKLVVRQGDKVYMRYKDTQNTFPGHASDREAVVYLNSPSDGLVRILESETPPGGAARILPAQPGWQPGHAGKIEYRAPLTVEVIDPDQAKDSKSTVTVEVTTDQGAQARVICQLSRAYAPADESMEGVRNPALFEGRFVGQIPLLLGNAAGLVQIPEDGSLPAADFGEIVSDEEKTSGLHALNTLGNSVFTATYTDDSAQRTLSSKASLASAASLRITDSEYLEDAEIAHVGTKLYLLLEDPDLDVSPERDKALVRILTDTGEDETLELEETLSHSGVFSASFPLTINAKPVPGNPEAGIECFFGDGITSGYLDNVPQTPDGLNIIERKIPVAVGTDGELSSFSKVYKDEDLAVETQFHIAESHFELFKGHRKLEQKEEAAANLEAGRRVLRQLREDYPDPKYAPRVSYLLGQFAQEMQAWDEAIAAYAEIVRNHPEHSLAPDAQYKLGQCYEEAGELDNALEAYVTLAATYPKSPLIANVMLRISEHFYVKEEFAVAASVGAKFVERFPNHEWTPKMAFRVGQCHYKLEEYGRAGISFDAFVKRFPEQELTAQALFWAGESYRMGNQIPEAFRRYNRCRWDFPESDAAKYSRGRLALPELLSQFEREANLNE